MKLKRKIIEQLEKEKKKRKDYGFIIVISCVYVSCVTIGMLEQLHHPFQFLL
jgi:hypothetical protein